MSIRKVLPWCFVLPLFGCIGKGPQEVLQPPQAGKDAESRLLRESSELIAIPQATKASEVRRESAQPPEFAAYYAMMQKRIKFHWEWKNDSIRRKCRVQIALSESGELTSAKLIESSGNQGFDEAVLSAIRKSSPFPPPDRKVKHLFRDVIIQFNK